MTTAVDSDAKSQVKQINAVILFTSALNIGFDEILDYLI